jgi:hypothetical protein
VILDEEVLAVVLAVTIVASVLGAALILRPEVVEPFTAIALLNEECKMGDYPRYAAEGSNLTLCIYVYNHVGKPVYYMVVYKLGSAETLPTNTTPSPQKPLASWRGVLSHGENTTFLVEVPVRAPSPGAVNATLIFELWIYDTSTSSWSYTGRWVHLHVQLVSAQRA